MATIATQLIKGTPAQAQVKAILSDWTLSDISVWPDCAKGIDPTKDYRYQHPGKYAECKLFETPQSEAEMSDFVRRNDTNCQPKPGEESCHKQHHAATDTRGGNNIMVSGGKLRAKWDAVPSNLASSNVNANWISQAQAVAPTDGDVYTWPASWASGALAQAELFKAIWP